MGQYSVFTKTLTAAVANGIAQTQAGSAGVPLVLNGSLTNFLSTTASAAVAAGSTILPVASVTGLVVGQFVTDTTTVNAIAVGTKIIAINTVTPAVILSQPVNGVLNADTIVFQGFATIDAASATNSAPGRRVAIAYTGTDTSFTIVGTDIGGDVITDVAVGNTGAAVSNRDFVTVTSITPVGGGLTGVTAGTNTTGSSPWWVTNWTGFAPMNVAVGVENIGTATWTIEHTYDDPNLLEDGLLFPTVWADPTLVAQIATKDGLVAAGTAGITAPIKACRLTITTGTGQLRCRFLEAGVG
jgi:hypothetical protein